MKKRSTTKLGVALAASALLFSSSAGAATRASYFVASSSAVTASSYQTATQGEALGHRTSVLPLVIGLAVVVAGLVFILRGDREDEIELPTSRG